MELVASTKLKTIKKPSEFIDLRNSGKRFVAQDWLIAVFKKSENFELGISVSSRDANAVMRNRLKRWAKEFFRRNQIDGVKLLLIFRNKRTKLQEVAFTDFCEASQKIIDRINT